LTKFFLIKKSLFLLFLNEYDWFLSNFADSVKKILVVNVTNQRKDEMLQNFENFKEF
jgi:hypothetical protein